MGMGKVVIDYEGFKEVLRDYLSENLIDEIISCMNDNLVFIEDIDEDISEIDDKKASTAVITTEEAMRKVKSYKYEKNLHFRQRNDIGNARYTSCYQRNKTS